MNEAPYYKLFIRWQFPQPRSCADGDPDVFYSPLDIPKKVVRCREEADRRLKLGAAFGATGYDIVLESVTPVVLESFSVPKEPGILEGLNETP